MSNTKLNMVQAINQTLHREMALDKNIVVLGEDVGKKGGVFGVTEGLWQEFGSERVMNTPLAESGIIGCAIGMALYGMKPIAEIQFLDFIYPAFDQIVSEAAKFRYRSGGQYTVPMVIRAPYGGGIKGGHYHSQSSEAYFCHTPGLKVVIPATPADAAGLLKTAIHDEDPVIFLEPKKMYRAHKEEVDFDAASLPFGKGRIVHEGSDLTLVGWGSMLHVCLQAAKECAERGVSIEVFDPRTLVPFDIETLLASVAKTGRVIIVQEAPRRGGFASEISAMIAERAIDYLESPITRVAGFDTPFPYSLENVYMPDSLRVVKAIKENLEF